MRSILLILALCTACAAGAPERRPRVMLPETAPERPGGLVPRARVGGALVALEEGEELYYKGELDKAAEVMEGSFHRLVGHPEWLPVPAADRRSVYRRLMVLYRLRSERDGDDRGLADWLALHLTDQDPSVLSVPPRVEAALSGRRDAVRARTALLSVEVRDPGEWEVYVDGRRLGAAPLRRLEMPVGLHAVEVRAGDECSWVRHRVLEPGGNRVIIEPALDRSLVLEEGRPAALNAQASLPMKIRAVGWLAQAAGAEIGSLFLDDPDEGLLVVPGGGFVRPMGAGQISLGTLKPPGRWRPWVALGLAIGAAAAGTTAGVLASMHNRSVRELERSPIIDTRPRIRRLKAGAWGALGVSLGLSLGAGGIGLWHLLDRGHPALHDLPPSL